MNKKLNEEVYTLKENTLESINKCKLKVQQELMNLDFSYEYKKKEFIKILINLINFMILFYSIGIFVGGQEPSLLHVPLLLISLVILTLFVPLIIIAIIEIIFVFILLSLFLFYINMMIVSKIFGLTIKLSLLFSIAELPIIIYSMNKYFTLKDKEEKYKKYYKKYKILEKIEQKIKKERENTKVLDILESNIDILSNCNIDVNEIKNTINNIKNTINNINKYYKCYSFSGLLTNLFKSTWYLSIKYDKMYYFKYIGILCEKIELFKDISDSQICKKYLKDILNYSNILFNKKYCNKIIDIGYEILTREELREPIDTKLLNEIKHIYKEISIKYSKNYFLDLIKILIQLKR